MTKEGNQADKIIPILEEKNFSRREFLEGALKAAQLVAGAGFVTHLGIPSIARAQDRGSSPENLVFNREDENFVWPEDIKGNEDFFGKDILLTIDDCYDFEYTRAMVTLMKQKGVKATFFPNTQHLDISRPDIVALWQDIKDQGFDIGYHTVRHETGMTQSELAEDLLLFEQQMRDLLNDSSYRVELVRPPKGNWNDAWMAWVREKGLTNVRWNFVPSARNGSVDYFKAVMDHPDGGRIILLHPREFDSRWLTDHIDELKRLAAEEGGRVTSITGRC